MDDADLGTVVLHKGAQQNYHAKMATFYVFMYCVGIGVVISAASWALDSNIALYIATGALLLVGVGLTIHALATVEDGRSEENFLLTDLGLFRKTTIHKKLPYVLHDVFSRSYRKLEKRPTVERFEFHRMSHLAADQEEAIPKPLRVFASEDKLVLWQLSFDYDSSHETKDRILFEHYREDDIKLLYKYLLPLV